jgi:hypothetical protein
MTTLADKLQLKPAHTAGRIVALPEGAAGLFDDWPTDLLTSSAAQLDFILAFVSSAQQIQDLAASCVGLLKPDGLLWFAYPKGSSGTVTDINRDRGWEPLTALGFRPVRQVSLDGTWSALRFREARRVKG